MLSTLQDEGVIRLTDVRERFEARYKLKLGPQLVSQQARLLDRDGYLHRVCRGVYQRKGGAEPNPIQELHTKWPVTARVFEVLLARHERRVFAVDLARLAETPNLGVHIKRLKGLGLAHRVGGSNGAPGGYQASALAVSLRKGLPL
ncbi:hypothetical protein [Nitrosovibrio sp. Nv4]|uniref:hypothetical protein n=1 Tax=Nitrosovibrio sp. Nv4 TaxID=1945880 RepID=UPI000BE2CC56|nr:hypothetical protein [Nitrosovibrio sp. Nv4]